jgi:hypothetical protein
MRVARPAATPIAARGFRHRLFEAFCLLLVAGCCLLVAWGYERSDDVLGLGAGAVILSSSSEYDSWPALALLDDDEHTGWASHRGHAGPHTIVIELPQLHLLESMGFDNARSQEPDFPGISARQIEIWLSTTSPEEGFELISTVEATQGGREVFPLPLGAEARWIKLVIASNWGNEEYTELMELEAYGVPVGDGPGPPIVGGTYLTNFGPLYLQQSGERVRGCYDDGTATVVGRLDGRMMRMSWRERDGFGSAVLTVSSGGDFLNGLWYEGDELRGTWRGPRDPGEPEPPCDIASVAWPQ